ncbi:MAG TPA: glycosyltransferase family 2 protein, partial [Dehalococcoidia bacterium]|nr:glycosyltransferase family 2 protein [Dehalococcoidia bacterium]
MLERPAAGGRQPPLSVVVCSYTTDRLADIRHLLSALQQQSYARLETVFVADGSPQLRQAVGEHVSEQGLERVRVVLNEGRPGLAAARNVGVGHAEGEIIAFIDDDAVPFADWGERIAAALARADAAGVTGPAFPLWEDESLAWLPEEFYWLVSCPTPGWLGWSDVREVRNAWGMNMAFRREAFRACRFPEDYGYRRAAAAGVPSHLLGEDTAFSV